MRLKACIGGLLLASTGCAQLPERIRIDIDGRSFELRKQGLSGLLQLGRWSASPDCAPDAPRLDPVESGERLVLLGPDHLQVTGKDGKVWSLYRCLP
jgi:hypothetical protein